ncbi:type II toxin-antitoxin system Phd/YefM family antitoxin [Microcoleus sp. A2-C5]|uniref:type II toxin-antitoxin system Phd/YefM family antitoxin n=1 Tax=unclassified Microcoleus TaxID=2642155 RepID=UPI002FD30EE2
MASLKTGRVRYNKNGEVFEQKNIIANMPKYLTIAEAQQQLPKWPDDLVAEPAIITKDGKSAIIALSFKQFESLLETIEILSDREFMAHLRSGIEQAQNG